MPKRVHRRLQRQPSVLVLGAGIQGICVALALRVRGYRVTMVDQMPDLMLRASLRNEGKIHLGFVYANDPSFRTSALMLRSALSFSSLLDEWLEMEVDWRAMSSVPFLYLVAADSMLAPAAIRAHYAELERRLRELVDAGERTSYLGQDLRTTRLWQSVRRERHAWLSPQRVIECVETPEVALHGGKFRRFVKARLAAMGEIEARYGHRVETVQRLAAGFAVEGLRTDGTRWKLHADVVINCLWEGRLVLDHQLGLHPRRAFVMRLKCRVLGELAPAHRALPSVTMVLGRYGDFVRYADEPSYFSWYPTCLRGWSQTIATPREWDPVCAGDTPSDVAEHAARETLDAFDAIIPGLRDTRVHAVDGGVIYSWGETDIDDSGSALHRRDEIGFTPHDGYYSVDTGKFTCAPLIAQQLAEHLDG